MEDNSFDESKKNKRKKSNISKENTEKINDMFDKIGVLDNSLKEKCLKDWNNTDIINAGVLDKLKEYFRWQWDSKTLTSLGFSKEFNEEYKDLIVEGKKSFNDLLLGRENSLLRFANRFVDCKYYNLTSNDVGILSGEHLDDQINKRIKIENQIKTTSKRYMICWSFYYDSKHHFDSGNHIFGFYYNKLNTNVAIALKKLYDDGLNKVIHKIKPKYFTFTYYEEQIPSDVSTDEIDKLFPLFLKASLSYTDVEFRPLFVIINGDDVNKMSLEEAKRIYRNAVNSTDEGFGKEDVNEYRNFSNEYDPTLFPVLNSNINDDK